MDKTSASLGDIDSIEMPLIAQPLSQGTVVSNIS